MKTVTRFSLACLFLIGGLGLHANAQQPGRTMPPGGAMHAPAIGHLFGKVQDGTTGKAIEFATVGLLRVKDSAVVSGMLTKGNGDFDLDKLPFGQYILKVNFLGYSTQYKHVAITPQNSEQDLGNFRLKPGATLLKTATVTGQKSSFSIGIDKKVFDVTKSIAAKGGTATDALREVPTVNVDIDGNVTLRNGTPTIYIDGKKSPLTLDEIPADEIQSIEIITNPSAKYDASGTSGIINIVLKKDRKPGVNGMVMAGAGTHNQYNGGLNLNVYQKPFNLTLNYFANRRDNTMTGTTDRNNLFSNTFLNQTSSESNNGLFQVGRIGLDYYLDNRNTISLSGGTGGGQFKSNGTINSSFLNSSKSLDSTSVRTTYDDHQFHFYDGDLNYTHNFTKEKEQLTAEADYRGFNGPGTGNYQTIYSDSTGTPYANPSIQQYTSTGKAHVITLQSDYTNPLNHGKGKLESGIKATLEDNTNQNTVNDYQYGSKDFSLNAPASYNYEYKQQTYAAYTNFANKIGNFSYQAGLRYENYMYQGTLLDSGYSFSYTKPGLFPSIFLGQKFKGNQEIQLNYSRRVHRPNFWQISPRVDYSDPLNLRKGNPHLQPEYTNSFEFTYDKMWNQGTSFYATLYFRNTNNEITSYVTPISSDTLLSTFVNANTSNSYGAELTLRTPITSWWDVTLNGNFYQTDIKASNLAVGLSNSGFSWFGKLVSETRLPKHFTLQLNGRYEGPRVIPQGTVQGFGALDAAIRKEFLKNNAASLSLSFSDIFNSERRVEHTETPKVFIQDLNRKRLSQIIRLNFSYRFGKQDFSLFKRKAKSAQQGQDNSMMMNPDDQ